MAAFLANVGVNAAHRVRSPLHPDGSFELLPIPEKEPWAPPMLRLPGIWAGRAVHLDPDLAGRPPTYGDNCRTAGRAFSLRQAPPGTRSASWPGSSPRAPRRASTWSGCWR